MYKILIVDDDRDLLEGQRLYLEGRGYAVQTAESLEEGMAGLEEFAPDLILADLMMEHYDSGFVFCKRVRDTPGFAHVPILMQTAAPHQLGFTFDPSDPEQKKWIKVEEVLTKPVPLEDLDEKIRQHVEAARRRQ